MSQTRIKLTRRARHFKYLPLYSTKVSGKGFASAVRRSRFPVRAGARL
jgi:hypothetical protein